jgi:hypothetical protein
MENYQKEVQNRANRMLREIEGDLIEGGGTSIYKIIDLVAFITLLSENGKSKEENERITRDACKTLETIEKKAEQRFRNIQQNIQKALSDISAKTGFKYTPTQDCANDLATIQWERSK